MHPDDDVVGGQFLCGGHHGRVCDPPRGVGVACLVEGILVVQRDVVVQPTVGINQQEAGGCRQPEIQSGDDSGDNFHHCPLCPMAEAAGYERIGSRRQLQIVVSAALAVGERLDRRAFGSNRHRAQQVASHLQGAAADGAGGQRLELEVPQRAIAVHYLYIVVGLSRVPEGRGGHLVVTGGHSHCVNAALVAGCAEGVARVLTDAFHLRGGQRQFRIGAGHLAGELARAQCPGDSSEGIELSRAVSVIWSSRT